MSDEIRVGQVTTTKAKALAALFNAAKTQGRAVMHYNPYHVMEEAEAADLLKASKYCDYVEGRVLKCNFENGILDTRLYNRDNGDGAAEDAVLDAVTQPDKE